MSDGIGVGHDYYDTHRGSSIKSTGHHALDALRVSSDTSIRGGLQVVKSLKDVDPKSYKVGMIVIINDGTKPTPWYQLQVSDEGRKLEWHKVDVIGNPTGGGGPLVIRADQKFMSTSERDAFFISHPERLEECPYCLINSELLVYDPTTKTWVSGIPSVISPTSTIYVTKEELSDQVGGVVLMNADLLRSVDDLTTIVPRSLVYSSNVVGYITSYDSVLRMVGVTTLFVTSSGGYDTVINGNLW